MHLIYLSVQHKEKELKSQLDKLRRDRGKLNSKQKELEAIQFPVKDELLPQLLKNGEPYRDLPPIVNFLSFSSEFATDALSTWDFLYNFR